MLRNWRLSLSLLSLSAVSLVLLSGGLRAADQAEKPAAKKKIVFVAGNPSHGYGAHEHKAGCMLLAKALNENVPQVEAVVTTNGWPKDTSIFNGASSIIVYSDGGGGHPFNAHLPELDKLMKQGVGMVAIHYGVEVPKGDSGNSFLDWIGGYFETNWSVNPHWTANYKKFPDHPISRGVKPFSINDEWYYHMRFPEKMAGVTPILTDLPPDSTLSRGDGPHSGNPFVRADVKAGNAQHMAWATERKDGGRGFGFTGGHDHWNWGNDSFRKLVLNAIVWTARVDVPEAGVPSKPLSAKDLMENQDEPVPENFNPERIQKMLDESNGKPQASAATPAQPAPQPANAPKPRFESKVVNASTPGHAIDIQADIAGAKQLYLVVTDAGDGFACDWADWMEPRLIGPSGEKKLTELKWKSGSSGWGEVRSNLNTEGKPLQVNGKSVEYGIGTHSNSVIAYDLPEGYTLFKARGGLDNGGTNQGGGSTVQFLVYVEQPAQIVATATAPAAAAPVGREPVEAVPSLDVAPGLEATLFAAEPMLLSPADIDVDHRGRVWVCEVVNYRHRNNSRPEGDRILILEDTNGDGKADKSTVFYQGRDIDSALGIGVLGNKVIVSCAPNVFVFTDEDGDGKADKKELLFTKVGQPQHDHSTHAFTFGPDGKLYWNVGNTGGAVHDKDGNIVVDLAGNEVRANGTPYRQGLVFRCNLDGTEFETLGHNFRNNYEVAVDSFGTLWQSDNDDDGNRGVRINYVMEFGNFGYTDEVTGAGWKTPRTNMEKEIPLQHWHLNDPGVIPNLVQTGAGSPTGICFYEGTLLPKLFQNQVIHCDAGPNIVRAYPAVEKGAGYDAEIVNILDGKRDNWFRPSDVCTAPDGSLIVADWYDPGVGGHRMGDIDKGRIFRVAPPGAAYKIPKLDVSTIEGAIEGLKSPNLECRYLAWTALHKQGDKAIPALQQVYQTDANPRFRARALWLLTKLPGQGKQQVEAALKNEDPHLRMVALRSARELKLDVIPYVKQLVRDPSPIVRRECAIALRHNKSAAAPALWAELASQHDGGDRWYLEALGISADKQWDAFLDAWLAKHPNDWNTPAGRDILWRSRATKTPEYLAKIVETPAVPSDELPRYFRAFDFLNSPSKDTVLTHLAFTTREEPADKRTFVSTESLSRLKGFDANGNAEHKAALNRVLDSAKGSQQFIDLVSKFNVSGRYPELLAMAQAAPDSQLGVEAVRTLIAKAQLDLLKQALADKDTQKAAGTAQAVGNSADGKSLELLLPVLNDAERSIDVRRAALRGVAQTKNGALELVKRAESGKLEENLKAATAAALHTAQWNDVKEAAEKLFPSPPSKENKPLPPITKLAEMKGDVARGKTVFTNVGTCNKCHIVNNEGKEVGPNLTEIGSKLSRQAFFESILYPSAGISHNFETWTVLTDSGNVVSGLLISQTGEEVVIRSIDAIDRKFKKSEIDEMKKQEVSLMPADLQKVMTEQDLLDVVEYLTTLKKK